MPDLAPAESGAPGSAADRSREKHGLADHKNAAWKIVLAPDSAELEALPDVLLAQNWISALKRVNAIEARLPHGGVTREGVVICHAVLC